MKNPLWKLFIGSVFLLGGCHHRSAITARSEYLDASYLASSRIETPDPCAACFTGQQVVISWNVPSRCLPAEIDLRVRYGNRRFQEMSHTVQTPQGFWVYRVMAKDFHDLQGIMAYSARLYSGKQLIGVFNHHLWAELVEIPNGDEVSLRLEPSSVDIQGKKTQI